MKVKPLTVGPILGAVTSQSARLLGRGDFQEDTSVGRQVLNWFRTQVLKQSQPTVRPFGVIRLRAITTPGFQSPHFFKLDPTFDLTGIAVLEGLSSTERYEYQMGWLSLPPIKGDKRPTLSLDWSEIPTYSFQTETMDSTQSRSFIEG